MTDSLDPSDPNSGWRKQFPAIITAVTNSSGTYLYSWTEVAPSASTGAFSVQSGPRRGTATQSPAFEIHNRHVSPPANTTVLMRFRAMRRGQPTYDFDGAGIGGAVTADTVNTTTLTVTNTATLNTTTTNSLVVNNTTTLNTTNTNSLVVFNSTTLNTLTTNTLAIYDTNQSHVLNVVVGTNLSADRTLTFTTGDADRNVTIPATGTMTVSTGVSGGQTVNGGTASGETLTLQGTTHSTPGTVDVLAASADTTSVREVYRIRHTTSGTSAAGFGVQQSFRLEDASGNEDTAGSVDVRWTDATHASEDAKYVVRLQRAGTITDAFTVLGTGAVQMSEVATPATPSVGTVLLYPKSDGNWYGLDDAGTETQLSGSALPTTPPSVVSLTAVPTWFLVNTLDHTDLTDTDTNQVVDAYTLPAKSFLHGWVLRTKTVGSGGGVTVLTLVAYLDGSGLAGQSTDGVIANNVVGSRVIDQTQGEPIRWASTATFQVQFGSDVNLDTLSGGEWEVYLLLSTLG